MGSSTSKRDFDPDWPHGHVTAKEGHPVRIICRDAKGESPIVALVKRRCGDELAYRYRADGSSGGGGYELVNAPAPKKRLQGWANVYLDNPGAIGCLFLYPTREAADENAAFGRIACLPLDFEEGEGL